jgi:hypothetical protein
MNPPKNRSSSTRDFRDADPAARRALAVTANTNGSPAGSTRAIEEPNAEVIQRIAWRQYRKRREGVQGSAGLLVFWI